jgi:hypothetical protein
VAKWQVPGAKEAKKAIYQTKPFFLLTQTKLDPLHHPGAKPPRPVIWPSEWGLPRQLQPNQDPGVVTAVVQGCGRRRWVERGWFAPDSTLAFERERFDELDGQVVERMEKRNRNWRSTLGGIRTFDEINRYLPTVFQLEH